MATAKVFAGICGFNTEIQAIPGEKRSVTLHVESECPDVTKIAQEFGPVYPLKEIFGKKLHETSTYQLTCRLPHVQCPVSVGILKAIEVASGLALPKDVHISISGNQKA